MITFKEVFESAKKKGYKQTYKWGWIDIDGNRKKEDLEKYAYLELCLIQQWLRYEHRIFVYDRPEWNVATQNLKFYIGISFIPKDGSHKSIHTPQDLFQEYYDKYEQGLLEGINEALKLI